MIFQKLVIAMNKISLVEMVNPVFYRVWNAPEPYILLKGGRGSFKSSVASLKVCFEMKKHTQLGHKVNVVCMMSQHKYLRDAVYRQIQWGLEMLNISNEFLFRVSPLQIIHKKTKSAFYFYGIDDPFKTKSNAIGDVIALWYEEAANFTSNEVFDQTNATFIRQKSPFADHVKIFYSWNPPKNPYNWVNEWIDSLRGKKDYLIHHSTYLDDELGFTEEQQLALIETYKENDYDYYRWLYLGEVIGMGDNVYNMNLFHSLNELPTDDHLITIDVAIDTGHQVSATTCLALGLTAKGNVILLDTYYYSPAGQLNKKAPSDLTKELRDFMVKVAKKYNMNINMRTIDSAEGGIRNQFFKDYQIRLHPVAKSKKADMIDNVHDLLAQGRFYYLDIPANKIFVEEHKKYQWDEKTLNTDKPEVIKEDDHTCDAFQYYVKDNLRKLKLIS